MILEGYKAIAAFLSECWQREVSAMSAYRYAKHKDDPLPVYWVRKRAFAQQAAVIEWAARQYIWRSLN